MQAENAKQNLTPKLLLTIEEAARALSLSRSLLYDLLMSNQIVSIKIGRARRIPVAALMAYVQQQIAQTN